MHAVTWSAAYHGLVRAIVRVNMDAATPLSHRLRMREIDVDRGATVVAGEHTAVHDIVVQAAVEGNDNIAPTTVTIPVSADMSRHSPLAVAAS